MFRKEVILRIGAVEREHRASFLAISQFMEHCKRNPLLLRHAALTPADLRICYNNCSVTYLVRMFAVFEESLRDVRRLVYGRNTPIKTYDLLQQCASRQHIPEQDLANAHLVREYRNSIVHGGIAPVVTVAQARSWLCKYFGWMPPKW